MSSSKQALPLSWFREYYHETLPTQNVWLLTLQGYKGEVAFSIHDLTLFLSEGFGKIITDLKIKMPDILCITAIDVFNYELVIYSKRTMAPKNWFNITKNWVKVTELQLKLFENAHYRRFPSFMQIVDGSNINVLISDLSDNITEETELTPSLANGDAETVLEHLLNCVEKQRNRDKQKLPSICVVPSTLRDLSPSSFTPLVVSIGPLHRDNEKTKEFQMVKERYMHDLLLRCRTNSSPPEQLLNECVEKVIASIDQIRASYAVIIPFSDIELAKMMIIDACFILEFCLKHLDEIKLGYENYKNILNGTLLVVIAVDLILIENQIPFFVLRDLFNCICGRRDSIPPVTTLLYAVMEGYTDPFVYRSSNEDILNQDTHNNESTHDHLLGLLHSCYKLAGHMPSIPTTPATTETTTNRKLKLVAMKMKSYMIACFSWWCRGKPSNLIVPTLRIYDQTEQILRNLISYEQTFPKVHDYFTSYVHALYSVVKDEEDVATLAELNILENHQPHKDAAYMIDALSKLIPDEDHLSSHQELMHLTNYYNSSWVRNLRRLRSTYFSSPWSAIAFVAGIIMFSLTIVQTVFTIKGPL
ncbi:UPF0481 protein At3g47200-like [Rutidosis leptorrhynchoides]|uniref:UPF0481 protein At3g47200-like n=1 Tax=Rutidosis leptorrhynchoides TaxID=125765 RepID=UPI003A994E5D